MQAFELPLVHGTCSFYDDVIFFSCDEKYYVEYGIPLIKSIINQINWIGIHCHVIYEDNEKSEILLSHPRLTHTYEIINQKFIDSIPYAPTKNVGLTKSNMEINPKIIYFACCRYLQLDKIITGHRRVLQIDCDTILFKSFSREEFINLTNSVRPMRKPKTPEKIIASAVSFGRGKEGKKFRHLLCEKIKERFNDGCYWFIDQVVLQEIFNTMQTIPIPQEWNTWSFKKKNAYFRTGKGNKKETNEMYINAVNKWRDTELEKI
jgi:lipopolysaccharide biosynthesis glycosyltransferase